MLTKVWGVLVKDNNPTESVHLFACKRFLNVAARIPNKMVYGEFGRHPLQINCYIRAIKYCFRLLKMDSERLPNQAYRMLMNLDSNVNATGPQALGQCYNLLVLATFG